MKSYLLTFIELIFFMTIFFPKVPWLWSTLYWQHTKWWTPHGNFTTPCWTTWCGPPWVSLTPPPWVASWTDSPGMWRRRTAPSRWSWGCGSTCSLVPSVLLLLLATVLHCFLQSSYQSWYFMCWYRYACLTISKRCYYM